MLLQKLSKNTGIEINAINFTSTVLTIGDTRNQVQEKKQKAAENDKLNKVPEGKMRLKTDESGNEHVEVETEDEADNEDPGSATLDVDDTDVAESSENTEAAEETETAEETEVVVDGAEASKESYIDVLEADITFKGTYKSLDMFLNNIYNHNKQIVVSSVSFNSNVDDEVKTGNIILQFYGIRDLSTVIEADEQLFTNVSSRGESEAYQPYPDFVVQSTTQNTSAPSVSAPVVSAPSVTNTEPNTNTNTNTNINTEPSTPPAVVKKALYGFESGDVFFVANDDKSSGSVALTNTSSSGKYGIELKYDFASREKVNRANIVFDKKKVMVYSEASALGLSVHTNGAFGDNKLGAVIVDATGNSSMIYFDIIPEDEGWTKTKAELPEGLNYPFMVQRIFVEGEGTNQILTSSIVVDELSYTAK